MSGQPVAGPPGPDRLTATRRSLHGVAELVVAGPQFQATGTMRLRVRPGGFGTSVRHGDFDLVAVDRMELLVVRAGSARRLPLAGTYQALADAAGLPVGGLERAYPGGSGVSAADALAVDADAASRLEAGWAVGADALREFGRSVAGPDAPEPVLWPEHFDVGITVEGVNYGVSPGDAAIGEPYAYVGPPQRLAGPFWNQPFGAARPLRELADTAAVTAFFLAGRAAASAG
jgi:hypothetical protein